MRVELGSVKLSENVNVVFWEETTIIWVNHRKVLGATRETCVAAYGKVTCFYISFTSKYPNSPEVAADL